MLLRRWLWPWLKLVNEQSKTPIPSEIMKSFPKHALKAVLIELVVYAGLVFGYFFLVLHFLGTWLHQLFEQKRTVYAFVALGLIVSQGVLLEMLTTGLLRLIRGEPEE